jgi:hypothetical protein
MLGTWWRGLVAEWPMRRRNAVDIGPIPILASALACAFILFFDGFFTLQSK